MSTGSSVQRWTRTAESYCQALPSLIYGKEIQEVEEGEAALLSPALAQDLHQADQAAVWPEQVPDALDHLWQRSADRLLPGVPGAPLNGLHPEACREARREADAEHW